MTAASQQGKVEQVFIKCKRGHTTKSSRPNHFKEKEMHQNWMKTKNSIYRIFRTIGRYLCPSTRWL